MAIKRNPDAYISYIKTIDKWKVKFRALQTEYISYYFPTKEEAIALRESVISNLEKGNPPEKLVDEKYLTAASLSRKNIRAYLSHPIEYYLSKTEVYKEDPITLSQINLLYSLITKKYKIGHLCKAQDRYRFFPTSHHLSIPAPYFDTQKEGEIYCEFIETKVKKELLDKLLISLSKEMIRLKNILDEKTFDLPKSLMKGTLKNLLTTFNEKEVTPTNFSFIDNDNDHLLPQIKDLSRLINGKEIYAIYYEKTTCVWKIRSNVHTVFLPPKAFSTKEEAIEYIKNIHPEVKKKILEKIIRLSSMQLKKIEEKQS
jgi:hypothetical protein